MDLKAALEILGFKDEKVPKMKHFEKKYHKLAMVHHPDKGGDENYFKSITEAYRIVGEYLEEEVLDESDDFEEEIARKTFKSFNFSNIKENMKSFTINIDNSSSTTWEKVLTIHYGQPLDKKVNGLHWKVKKYTDGNVTANIMIGKWHIPKKDKQSKLLIQSNENGNFLPAHFVDNVLPKLLEEVSKLIHQDKKCISQKLKSKTPLRKLTHPRTSAMKTFRCNKCDYRTNVESQLVKHKKSVHEFIPLENSLCTSQECHCLLCGKLCADKNELSLHEKNVHERQCGICGWLFFTQHDLNLHVLQTHTNAPEIEKHPEKTDKACDYCPYLTSNSKLKCSDCDFTSNSQGAFKVHIQDSHAKNQERVFMSCLSCEMTFQKETISKYTKPPSIQ